MTDQLTTADADRNRSRDRFRATAAAVRARLDPARLSADGKAKARDAVTALPSQIADAARARPAVATGIVSAALLILLRKPIFGAFKRLTKEEDNG